MEIRFADGARRAAAALALGATALLASCAEPPSPPLRVVLPVWTGYEPAYLARDLNLFDTLRVHVVDVPSSVEAMRSLRTGVADVAGVSLDYALQLAEGDSTVRIMWVSDASEGGDAVVGRAGLSGIADLRGKRVGVEASTFGIYVLSRALEGARLSPEDVTMHSVDVSDHEAALLRGDVDAVVTYEPMRTRLLAAGAVELFSTRAIPGEVIDVLVTRDSVVSARQDDLARMMAAWERGRRHLVAQPADAARRAAAREGLDAAQLAAALRGIRLFSLDDNRRMLDGRDSTLAWAARRFVPLLRARGHLRGSVDAARFVDRRVAMATP